MIEYLQFVLFVPVSMPEINETSPAYHMVMNEKIKEIESELMKLPDDWEYEFVNRL